MTISKTTLISEFGSLVEARSAALFIGAGISVGAGLPAWSEIADALRKRANIPPEVTDASLVAEYFALREGGHAALDAALLKILAQASPQATRALRSLVEIPVLEFWTTNYDTLIEENLPTEGTVVVADDADYARKRSIRTERRVIKIHGTLASSDAGGPHRWAAPPIMTRGDFERYPQEHPILWPVLKAGYLSRSMLFLGISFDDPNLHVLQALSRAIPESQGGPPHYAVMRVPKTPAELDVWQWRRDDLEGSGVRICEVQSFDELDGITVDLARRSRPRQIFVGGSWRGVAEPERSKELAIAIGAGLAHLAPDFAIQSLAGSAAIDLATGMREAMTAKEYSPNRIVFHYRRKHGAAAPALPSRMGTSVYWDENVDTLRAKAISSCRALLVLGGGDWTEEEVAIARKHDIPIVPLASTGGFSRELWQSCDARALSGTGDPEIAELWGRLGEPGVRSTTAATQILKRLTFIDT